VALTARFPNPRSAFRRGGAMHLLLGETVAARRAGMRAASKSAFRIPQSNGLAISTLQQNLDPEWCVSITASIASTYQMYHRETFDNPLGHSMFQNPLFAPHPDDQTLRLCARCGFRAFPFSRGRAQPRKISGICLAW